MDMLSTADADGGTGFDLLTVAGNIGPGADLVYMAAVGERDSFTCHLNRTLVLLCLMFFLNILQYGNPPGFFTPCG